MELDKILHEIARLKKADELLNMIWNEINVYKKTQRFSEQTMKELEYFFTFNDNE